MAAPIAGLPGPLAGVRIAHVSDFHFRRWDRPTAAAQQLLLSLDYDLLVATGDFADSPMDWRRAAELTERFFAPLAERNPIYATLGNHDPPALATRKRTPLDGPPQRPIRPIVVACFSVFYCMITIE